MFLGAGLRLGLPSHPASRRRSCLRLGVAPPLPPGDSHPQSIAHAGRTQARRLRRRGRGWVGRPTRLPARADPACCARPYVRARGCRPGGRGGRRTPRRLHETPTQGYIRERGESSTSPSDVGGIGHVAPVPSRPLPRRCEQGRSLSGDHRSRVVTASLLIRRGAEAARVDAGCASPRGCRASAGPARRVRRSRPRSAARARR